MRVRLTVEIDLPQSSIHLTPIEVGATLQRFIDHNRFPWVNELRAIGAVYQTATLDEQQTTLVVAATAL